MAGVIDDLVGSTEQHFRDTSMWLETGPSSDEILARIRETAVAERAIAATQGQLVGCYLDRRGIGYDEQLPPEIEAALMLDPTF